MCGRRLRRKGELTIGAAVGCGHVSGLFARLTAAGADAIRDLAPNQFRALGDARLYAGSAKPRLRPIRHHATIALASKAPSARAGSMGPNVRTGIEPHAAAAAPVVGAAVGALVALLGGALTLASRSVTSGLVGAVRDLD